MPRQYSLKKKKEFERLFNKGLRKSSKNFSIVFSSSKATKIAYIVRKKEIPKSASRTYSKRVIREIVMNGFFDKISSPINLAIMAKSDLKQIVKTDGFESVKKELSDLLAQIDFERLKNQHSV